MPERVLNGPDFAVMVHPHDTEIITTTYRVPASKFGPMRVLLTRRQAERLAQKLLAAVKS